MEHNRDYIKNIIRKNAIVVVVLLIFLALGEVYVFQSARNVVFMDFWRNINIIIYQKFI